MEQEEFIGFLKTKRLSLETQKVYLIYYSKLVYLIKEVGQLNQKIVNSFISRYPHNVSKAFLKNYLEFLGLENKFKIIKVTGRVKRKVITPLTKTEIESIRENLCMIHPKYVLIFDLTLACALRRQEVINIKIEDILWDKQTDGTANAYIKITKAKGNKERIVFLNWEDGAKSLYEWIFKMNDGMSLKDYLFLSKNREDKPIDKTLWNKAFSKASGKRFHPHLLRHTQSTRWFEKGVDIVRIQQRLGHSDITTTRKYISPDERKELDLWSKE
jgi:integrase